MESPEDTLPGRPSEQPLRRQPRAAHTRRWIGIAVAVALALIVLFAGTALYTDRPDYCSTCHEMRPYVDAWKAGTHKDVWCVDCHVNAGYPGRFAHKFEALGEVVAHFRGDTLFPRANAPAIADTHCTGCHAQVTPKKPAAGFDHAAHQKKATCQACHPDAGHAVTDAALTAVGAFNPNVKPVGLGNATAGLGQGSANVPGHVTIGCTRCHDLKKTGCPACHKTPAKHFKPASSALPTCTTCHAAGPKWAFTHPSKGECQDCHTYSAKHFTPATHG